MQNITFNPWKKINSLTRNNLWIFECYYPDGTLKWREVIKNLVVDEGLYHSLDVIFKGGTAYSNWYVGIFEDDKVPVAGWDYAGIDTDQTEFTPYDEATRPQWSPGAITTLSLTDEVTFTASTGANTTIYGAFLG